MPPRLIVLPTTRLARDQQLLQAPTTVSHTPPPPRPRPARPGRRTAGSAVSVGLRCAVGRAPARVGMPSGVPARLECAVNCGGPARPGPALVVVRGRMRFGPVGMRGRMRFGPAGTRAVAAGLAERPAPGGIVRPIAGPPRRALGGARPRRPAPARHRPAPARTGPHRLAPARTGSHRSASRRLRRGPPPPAAVVSSWHARPARSRRPSPVSSKNRGRRMASSTTCTGFESIDVLNNPL